jgi:hypothetical protein
MKPEKYEEILDKLNKHIYNGRNTRPVSPTSVCPESSVSGIPHIKAGMNLSVLSQNQLTLIHSLLHNFYAKGGTKELQKRDIEKLHKEIKEKIRHEEFDSLDKNDNRTDNRKSE